MMILLSLPPHPTSKTFRQPRLILTLLTILVVVQSTLRTPRLTQLLCRYQMSLLPTCLTIAVGTLPKITAPLTYRHRHPIHPILPLTNSRQRQPNPVPGRGDRLKLQRCRMRPTGTHTQTQRNPISFPTTSTAVSPAYESMSPLAWGESGIEGG